MPKQPPMGKPKINPGTLVRVFKMLFKFYPVLLPLAMACIIFSAVTATLPAIFQQQIIADIEVWYKTGDWASASQVIIPKVLTLLGFFLTLSLKDAVRSNSPT